MSGLNGRRAEDSAASSPRNDGARGGGLETTQREDPRDLHDLHAPIMREKTRPADGLQPIPLPLIFAFGTLLLWGGLYLGANNGSWREDVFSPGGPMGVPTASDAKPSVVDTMALGQRVYANCRACHQSDGNGVAGVFPPLRGSEWVTGDEGTLARILLQGMQGKVIVRGEAYRGVMPAWSQLSDEQLAGVLSYIRASWGNDAAPVTPATVKEVRQATKGRSKAWTASELKRREGSS